MSQEALQSRLDAVFGALHPPGDQPSAWRPSTEQVFKDGGVAGAEQGASSDEEAEFEERARREVVPVRVRAARLPTGSSNADATARGGAHVPRPCISASSWHAPASNPYQGCRCCCRCCGSAGSCWPAAALPRNQLRLPQVGAGNLARQRHRVISPASPCRPLQGLAMDLATEDEPDEEGFRPSTAFCRALDREEEYTDVDELATGTYRSGREALPPRSMEVLEDNVWEQRIAQRDALRHGGGEGAGAGERPGQPAAMDTDAAPAEGAAAAEQPCTQQAQQGEQEEGRARSESQEAENGSQRSSEGGEAAGGQRPALASGARPKGAASKRVRFLGVPEPWVPPHRREGFVPRWVRWIRRCRGVPGELLDAAASGRVVRGPMMRSARTSCSAAGVHLLGLGAAA